MQKKYFMEFVEPTGPSAVIPALDDTNAVLFQLKGQINIRIPRADIEDLLRLPYANGEQFNTDTMMAIVSNDGHGGSSTKYVDLYINFQPEILTVQLPAAVEGQEYNINRDSTRAIRISDVNQDQKHTFRFVTAS